MAEKKQKRITYTSPKGVFKWPKLTAPDTKFKEEGEYSVSLVIPSDTPGVDELVKMADDAAAASLAQAKKDAKTPAIAKKWTTKYLPYKNEEDEDGEETGNIEFKFSMKASGVSKKTGEPWSRKPALFDARGRGLPATVQIWGGTVGKIAFQLQPYASTPQSGASVKFALEAAQILDLVSNGQKEAGAYGFGEEEGYEAPAAGDSAADDDDADTDGEDDGSGDF